jgi:peptide/nickel transport system substrate-binding protein
LSLVSIGGFFSPVSLGIPSVPQSFETSFEPQGVVPNGSSILTVRTQPTTKNGSYVLTVTATGGGKNHSTSVTLIVQGSGCLIATATYGSELASEVQFLRGFREERVMPTLAGRQFLCTFNMFYYSFSPKMAGLIESDNSLRVLCKAALYPLISILMFTARLDSLFVFYPEIGVIIVGFVSSVLIGIVYFSPIAIVLKRILRACGVNLKVRLEEPIMTVLLASIVAISVGEAFSFYATISIATAIFVLATVCLSVTLFMMFLDSCLRFFRV